MKTLQDQYKLIKEGKGHKGVFLKEAKQMFPNYIRNAATFEEASNILKDKNIISENLVGLEPINTISRKKESYETAFENFLEEARKKNDNDPNAEIKKVSQQVEDKLKNNFDRTDKKNPDNQIFGEIMKGYYCEMKDPKNADKTEEQLRDIVLKNLAKDHIYYTKNGMFGEKGVGVEMDVPGLGEPKEPKGKYKSSGYGNLKEGQINEIESLQESKLRKVIRESIEKELAAINKEAELEVLSSKLEKIEAAIEKRNSQLSKLDEDEDMKALTDKKKIKSLEKDIKTLEKAKAKIEKQLSKVSKKNKDANVVKKEVIDEDTPLDEGETQDALAASEKKLDDISGKTDELIKKLEEDENKPSKDEAVEMKRELESYFDRVGSAKEAVELYIQNHPEDEKHENLLLRIAMWVFDEVDDIEKTDLFEEDENMPSEDEAFKMKDELKSYLDRVGSAEEAVELYMKNHPEGKINKNLLLFTAKEVFDEEVE